MVETRSGSALIHTPAHRPTPVALTSRQAYACLLTTAYKPWTTRNLFMCIYIDRYSYIPMSHTGRPSYILSVPPSKPHHQCTHPSPQAHVCAMATTTPIPKKMQKRTPCCPPQNAHNRQFCLFSRRKKNSRCNGIIWAFSSINNSPPSRKAISCTRDDDDKQ